jgi:hypothetical protein
MRGALPDRGARVQGVAILVIPHFLRIYRSFQLPDSWRPVRLQLESSEHHEPLLHHPGLVRNSLKLFRRCNFVS